MSAQELFKPNIETIKVSIDKSISNIGNTIIVADKFLIKHQISCFDIAKLLYFKKLLERTDCELLLTAHVIETINKITLKYI